MSRTERLRVGVVAPPWLAVPPLKYGGTELIIDVLARGLQQRGHDVELFTVGSSTCDVPTRWIFDAVDPDRMGAAVLELRHVAAAYDALAHCDIVHDHTLAGLFLSQLHPELNVVATNHGPFNDDLADLYGRAAATVPVIAISHDQAASAPAGLPIGAVIHHGLDLDRYPIGRGGGDYVVTLGRMSPDKGLDTAIEVARRAGMNLVIAAKMQEPGERRYFEDVIAPKLGRGIEYVGEVDHAGKIALLQEARALLNPIRWPEPFGLVMAEALACGTPVVGTPCGAAPEIVDHGRTGFLGSSTAELIRGVQNVGLLDRAACRAHVERNFSMSRMARDHESFYRSVLAERRGQPAILTAPTRPALPQAGRPFLPVGQDCSMTMPESRPSTSMPAGSASIVTRV